METVAVSSHSFSRNPQLRKELLERYPIVNFNETHRPLSGGHLVEFLRGHAKAITGLERLDDAVFDAVPELRLVSKYGVGLDMIDIEAARRHRVTIRWTPGVNKQAVAELAVGFMIALSRSMLPLATDLAGGTWGHGGGRQLSSACVGVLGCGHVGQQVARICRAFGAKVLAHDILRYDEFYREADVTPVTLESLLRDADIVTIHVPLDQSTRGMIGAQEIGLMRHSAFLINTARGGIVDEQALKEALREKRLGAAAFDVFAEEPPGDLELFGLRNFIGTPHIGGATGEAVLAMGRAAILGLDHGFGSINLTSTKAPNY